MPRFVQPTVFWLLWLIGAPIIAWMPRALGIPIGILWLLLLVWFVAGYRNWHRLT